MKSILILIWFVLLVNLLIGCRTTYSENQTSSSVSLVNNNGNLKPAVSGDPQKTFIFREVGDVCLIKEGETFQLFFENINFSNSAFEIETDLNTKEIKIKLVDIDNIRVSLSSKCQTKKIIKTGLLPQIELDPSLEPEQVVLTPLFDNECTVIGYEYRYGSEERGCKTIAKETLIKFSECSKKFKKVQKRNAIPCPNNLLGLPCK